jgi:hypothetical protein
MKHIEKIEKEFDEKFDNLMVFHESGTKLIPMREDIKSFISSLLAKQQEEFVKMVDEIFSQYSGIGDILVKDCILADIKSKLEKK